MFSMSTIFACPICGALVKQSEERCPGCNVKLLDWGVSPEELVASPTGRSAKNWEEISKDFATRLQKIERELKVRQSGEVSPPLKEVVVEKPKPTHLERKVKTPELLPEPPEPPPVIPVPVKAPKAELPMSRLPSAKQGRVNGTKKGLVNGNRQGRVNGTGRGRVNGLKRQAKEAEEKRRESGLHARIIGSRLPIWQFLVVLVIAILILSSVLVVFSRSSQTEGIKIDGYFTDWASIPSYRFSTLLPGIIDGITESRLSFEQYASSPGRLSIYLDLQDVMFTGSEMSTVYAFIDTDADADTGYIAGESMGADLMMFFSIMNSTLVEAQKASFDATQDCNDWNSWQSFSSISIGRSENKIEASVDVLTTSPLVELVTYVWGEEHTGPIMSPDGMILAKQEPLINNSVTTADMPNVLRVSLIAMGVPAGDYIVQPKLANDTGSETLAESITINTHDWTTRELTAPVSSVGQGESFRYSFQGTASDFDGAMDVMGDSCSGYYMMAPAKIVVDGLFGDWSARKFTDVDSAAMTNPNIDIREYGAATQDGSYYMYVGTVGKTLEGSDVPEKRKKSTPGEGGGGSVVRLKKTGEDLLRAFIDTDASTTGTGELINNDNATIEADCLVEIFGRNGIVTESSVKKWSVSDEAWKTAGALKEIGVGSNGLEFSLDKTMLGNLTNSEIIFFTTDWEGQSDNCWLNGALTDPWVVRGTSTTTNAYMSNDGTNWLSVGSISLIGSDTVVAMAHSLDRTYVFAVTNTGRVYDWHVNVDSTWGDEVTGLCNSTNVVGIAPNTISGEGGCLILASNGWTWITTTLGGARGWTNGSGKVAGNGIYDFKDVCYNATGGRYWAIRSTANTNIFYSSGGAWTQNSKKTGAGSNQVHVYHIGSSAGVASEQIFILRQDGSIRYSADGGANWADRGNLPAPNSGGLPANSRYVAIDRDSNGIFWAITNNSYVYNSNDRGDIWAYKSNSIGANDIVSLSCPAPYIPEFDSILVPVIAIVPLVFFITSKSKKRKGLQT